MSNARDRVRSPLFFEPVAPRQSVVNRAEPLSSGVSPFGRPFFAIRWPLIAAPKAPVPLDVRHDGPRLRMEGALGSPSQRSELSFRDGRSVFGMYHASVLTTFIFFTVRNRTACGLTAHEVLYYTTHWGGRSDLRADHALSESRDIVAFRSSSAVPR